MDYGGLGQAQPRLGRRGSIRLLAGGGALLGLGLWAFLRGAEHSLNVELAGDVLVPLLVTVTAALSWGRRTVAIVVLLGLLDLEALLLGAGPESAFAFAVIVPLLAVGVATWGLPPDKLRLPFLGAWLCGIGAVGLQASREVTPDQLVVALVAFAAADAIPMLLLWALSNRQTTALEALARAESRLRELLDGVDLFAIVLDREARISYINPFALNGLQTTRERALGQEWFATFAAVGHREGRREFYRQVMAGAAGHDPRRESVVVTATGETRQIRWSHTTIHDADGRIAGQASIGEDVTAARAAEREARRASELMTTLVVSSPLPAAIFNPDLTMQLWNPAAAELLGWPREEVVGQKLPRILDHGDRWPAGRLFARALRGEAMRGEEIRFRKRDGALVLARVYGGPLRDTEGRVSAVAIQIVDVTAQQAMEQRLREAQKMEAVGRLAGGVAHDFNNSLTAIGGFAALISAETDDAEIREEAETIMAAVRRAGNLTRELLAYSRHSLLQPETMDVNALVGAVRPMLRRLLREDVQLVIESGVSEAFVRVDPGQLEQALLNLAVNARDAMPEGGRLTIVTNRRPRAEDAADGGDSDDSEAAGEGAPGWVAIEVSDTGAGIPAELQAQVFDPFFTTKPVGVGTGLGLAMVQGFVAQSGGRVGLRSAPGQGTSVEILLPEVPPSTDVRPVALPAEAGADGATILYVEDEPAVAAAGFHILSRRGYRVLLADSGETALALLRGHGGPIALLLTDVILPDVRGPQIADAARSLHPEAAVLFATGYSADAIGLRGELPAGVDLIEKPYGPEQLLERVAAAIQAAKAAKAA